eukprot:SAG11_NODE_9188_length_934_cov_1.615569_1_plen_92_part_01
MTSMIMCRHFPPLPWQEIRLRAISPIEFLESIRSSGGDTAALSLDYPSVLAVLRAHLPAALEAASLGELGALAAAPHFGALVLESSAAAGCF